jgi:hypothetical protein
MARRESEEEPRRRRRTASTPEGRENQMINLAVDEAERQIRSGNASSQIITHYLKLGTTREMLEQERLRRENTLLEARATAMANAERMEELMREALDAFRGYKMPDAHDEPPDIL